MMILVSAGRNGEDFLLDWHASILKQSHKEFAVLAIDDGSTDGSAEIMGHLVMPGLTILREPDDRRWGLYNKSVAILEEMEPDDDDIIVSVDLDDFLLTTFALETVARIFRDPEVWLSYGGILPMVGKWDSKSVAGPMDWKLPPRKQSWKATSIRAWRWFLMKNISKKDLQNGAGNWLKFPEDRITMYPMLEMAGRDHVHCYSGPAIYGYNDGNSESDRKVNAQPIQETLSRLLAASSYPLKVEEELRAHDCDWL